MLLFFSGGLAFLLELAVFVVAFSAVVVFPAFGLLCVAGALVFLLGVFAFLVETALLVDDCVFLAMVLVLPSTD